MKKIFTKIVSLIVAFVILVQSLIPTKVYALTSGPKSPDFSGFTPATTTDMVDLSTGDFNYNLPLLEVPGSNGGGYPISLSYNSNINSEQEASWVGFGWTLNAGNIDRNLRGYPDDYSNQEVDFYNKTRPNWTIYKTISTGAEVYSFDGKIESSTRFNNYNGYYFANSVGLSVFGVGARVTYDDKGTTFSPEINVIKLFNSFSKRAEMSEDEAKASFKSSFDISNKLLGKFQSSLNSSLMSNTFGVYTYCQSAKSVNVDSRKGWVANFSTNLQLNPGPTNIGFFAGLNGGFNVSSPTMYAKKNAFGYFNTSECGNSLDLMDYYMEKESPFSKRDIFIGMPFSNNDIFSVTGEGVTGGFRAYPERVQNYRPGAYNTNVSIYNIGVEIGAGLFFSGGLDVGTGSQKTEYKNWGFDYPKSSKNYFRFNNDLGGEIEYTKDGINATKGMVHAKLEKIGGVAGYTIADLLEDDVNNLQVVKEDKANPATCNKTKSSTHIEPIYLKYGQIEGSLNRKNIGGFRITNTEGDLYEYGMPVYVRNDAELSFNIDVREHYVKNNYLAFRRTPLKKTDDKYGIPEGSLKSSENKTVVGQIKSVPYATSFLLTQIKKSNYIDANSNGIVDDGDFGGWTKLSYRKIFGSNSEHNKWYRYRNPYNGLYFGKNSISDPKDDVGSVTTGEKEVVNLHTIETDSHIAFFVTNKYRHSSSSKYNVPNGSQVSRRDCKAAAELGEDGDPHSLKDNQKMEDDAPEYLEKILLFSKDDPTTPIKVVCFKYSNKLVAGLPNCQGSGGKLTLEKVWFEYGNAKPIKVSPYEFCYEYKKSTQVSNPEFKRFFEDYDKLEGFQNPTYKPEQLDTWGMLQLFGEERKDCQIPWRYQGCRPEYGKEVGGTWRSKAKSADFDPAAWHLKSIKLPSGGEIVIQYEEKDYKYVQDRPVMAMASLLSGSNTGSRPYYDVNVDDLGCNPFSKDEVERLNEVVNSYFQNVDSKDDEKLKSGSKVYFKFLFSLFEGTPSINSQNSEYITGYSAFRGSKVVERPDGSYCLRVELGSESSSKGEKTQTPRQGAVDFYNSTRKGLMSTSLMAPNYAKEYDGDVAQYQNGLKDVKLLALEMFSVFSLNSSITRSQIPDAGCTRISPALSFLKLPLLNNKKGGGVRVKRLMVYDSGLGIGQESLFGSEYHYVLSDGKTSSGVASNEPAGSREENPLIQYVIRKGQTLFSRLTVGEDVEQTEGPIGESLLPAPSITYSRVVSENIFSSNKKITPSGFTVNEYYTTFDFPFDDMYNVKGSDGNSIEEEGSGIEMTELQSNHEKLPELPNPIFSLGNETLSMEQGFRFIINSMNGKPKSITVYGGRYGIKEGIDGKEQVDDTYYGYLVTQKILEYYQPGEKVKTLFPVGNNGEYIAKYTLPGKEEEIAVEKKAVSDYSNDLNVEFDVGVSLPLSIQFSLLPAIKINTSIVQTHATTRILRYPAILKSESDYKDGVTQKIEYLAFNSSTGQPMIVKTSDIYADESKDNTKQAERKSSYNLTIPAHWIYPEMGRKEVDDAGNAVNSNQLNDVAFNLLTYNQLPQPTWFKEGKIPGVIAADVTTYEKGWTENWNDPQIAADYEYDKRCIPQRASNPSADNSDLFDGSAGATPGMINALKDKLSKLWRLKSTYKYKAQKVTQKGDNSFNQGFFPINTMFDWAVGGVNPEWLKVSDITKYSPNGNPLEEVDFMGIPSSVKYNKMGLPSVISQNSRYSELYFEDFEMNKNGYKGDSHSGKSCLKLYQGQKLVSNLALTRHLISNGAVFKLWAKSLDKSLSFSLNGNKVILSKISSSGEWSLYSADLSFSLVGKDATVDVKYEGAGQLLVDDVLFKPSNAKSTCYVYDNSKRLLNQFDDQHFSLVYTYNQEGQLTHKKVETERGVKTIQETMYNIPVKERSW